MKAIHTFLTAFVMIIMSTILVFGQNHQNKLPTVLFGYRLGENFHNKHKLFYRSNTDETVYLRNSDTKDFLVDSIKVSHGKITDLISVSSHPMALKLLDCLRSQYSNYLILKEYTLYHFKDQDTEIVVFIRHYDPKEITFHYRRIEKTSNH